MPDSPLSNEVSSQHNTPLCCFLELVLQERAAPPAVLWIVEAGTSTLRWLRHSASSASRLLQRVANHSLDSGARGMRELRTESSHQVILYPHMYVSSRSCWRMESISSWDNVTKDIWRERHGSGRACSSSSSRVSLTAEMEERWLMRLSSSLAGTRV